MKIAIVGVPGWSERLRPKLGGGFDMVEVDPSDGEQLARVLAAADIVISGRFDARTAALCHSLKLLICPWAGTENIDRSALPPGVKFVNAGGTEEPIAEHVIAMLVALRRRLLDADRKLRDGIWAYGLLGRSVRRRDVGLDAGAARLRAHRPRGGQARRGVRSTLPRAHVASGADRSSRGGMRCRPARRSGVGRFARRMVRRARHLLRAVGSDARHARRPQARDR